MANDLFRKQSLEEINSPEQLDSYVKVMSSGMWFFCIAILCIIAGFSVWGVFGKLKSYVYGVCTVDDIYVYAYVDSQDYHEIQDGQNCVINGVTFKVEKLFDNPIKIDDSFDEYIINYGGFQQGQFVNLVYFDNKDLPAGVYACEYEVEEISPFSFLFN